ncbi:MAG: hypothetical protein LM600_02490 [Thaumarchaeota archaeon]|jgi:hypothetical protein|nr:hypothetical protein [Nitrososphaerota archaeon]
MGSSIEFRGFVMFKGDRTYIRRDAFGEAEVGRLKVSRKDVLEFFRGANASSKIKQTKSGAWILDETLYKQLVVYTASLSSMRKRTSLRLLKLAEIIRKLDEYSLHFWYTEIVERYRKGGLRAIGRVARALRVLYGVDK